MSALKNEIACKALSLRHGGPDDTLQVCKVNHDAEGFCQDISVIHRSQCRTHSVQVVAVETQFAFDGCTNVFFPEVFQTWRVVSETRLGETLGEHLEGIGFQEGSHKSLAVEPSQRHGAAKTVHGDAPQEYLDVHHIVFLIVYLQHLRHVGGELESFEPLDACAEIFPEAGLGIVESLDCLFREILADIGVPDDVEGFRDGRRSLKHAVHMFRCNDSCFLTLEIG